MVVQRAETVLRRSDELLAVGQPNAALSAVSEIFASKRFRTTPLSQLEPIMHRFLELCVELRKQRTAKEGLHLYKNVAQNTSVASVETVLQAFIARSKERLEEALKKVDEVAPVKTEGQPATDGADAADVEDLEATETPESILLSAVSDEDSRDRTYRTIVTPWLRFLWEAYRTALDILRNNVRLEVLYQTTAHEAFAFCLQHQRKTEFRRLCETLRQHLTNSQKYTHQTHSINLSDPDTLQRHLDTRFQQLNTAVELELWQEAFRTAEDIHGLVVLSKRAPKASMMAIYYEKLVKVFAVGSNFLFHAAAYGKWHLVQPPATATSADADRKGAALVLLSALAVPIGLVGPANIRRDGVVVEDSEAAKGKATRLANLLSLPSTPTRAGLLRDAMRRDVLRRVSPQLRTLYRVLETSVDPLELVETVDPILSELLADPETARYVEPLKTVVFARLFESLGQIYDALDLERAIHLARFPSEHAADPTAARARVERYIAEACRRGDLDVTLDHAGASIRFNRELFVPFSDVPEPLNALQPSPGALLRTQLMRLGKALRATNDPHAESSAAAQLREHQRQALALLVERLPKERVAILARKHTLAARRQKAEDARQKREEEEAKQRAARMAAKAEEMARAEQQARRQRELDLIRKEADATRAAEAAKLAKSLQEKGAIAVTPDVSKMTRDEIVQLSVDQAEKLRKELNQSGSTVAKRMDHLERAMRQEERPLLEIDYEQQQARDKAAHEAAHQAIVDAGRATFEADATSRVRLQRILVDYRGYRERVGGKAEQARKDKEAAARAKIEEEKQQRIAERRAQLKAEREERIEAERLAREQEEREKAEAEQREREEAERLEREAAARAVEEERQRLEAAAVAARKAEQDAERAKLDDIAAKQRAREAEVEARLAAERDTKRAPAAASKPIVGAGGWRREGAPPAASATPSPPASGERPRLNLAPRSTGAAPSWREREAAKSGELARGGSPSPAVDTALNARPNGSSSPAPPTGVTSIVSNADVRPSFKSSPKPAQKDESDGFQEVAAAKKTPGKYVPPSQRTGGAGGGDRWRK